MITRQDKLGNIEELEGALDELHSMLAMLSWTPYLNLGQMAARRGRGKTSTRKLLTRAEQAGWVAHVLHGMQGRKGSRRYMLTGLGVQELANALAEVLADEETSEPAVRTADLLDRPGTTGRALATHHRRLDILIGVYQTAATVAACFDEPELRVHIPRAGQIDGVVRMPTEPYSLGVLVQRPSMDTNYFGLKIWRYREQMETKPSALLIVAHSPLAEHGVKRLVQRNWDGLFLITSLECLGDPAAPIWREPNRDDGVEAEWSTRQILRGIPKESMEHFVPTDDPYTRVAIPRLGWRPSPVLTPAQWRILYSVADWQLAGDGVIAALADVTLQTLNKAVMRLREHKLVDWVETRFGERRLALTDAGIRFICWTARAGDKEARKFWSARKRADGKFVGTKLQKLNYEIRHTTMVHDIVALITKEARAAVDVETFQIWPAHLTERRPVMPDARIDLQLSSGERYVLLLEAERESLDRAKRETRLDNYGRVWDTQSFMDSFPVRPQIAVVFKDADSERTFGQSRVEAGRTALPVILTNMDELSIQGGILQAVWRRPWEDGCRNHFWYLK